MDENEILRKLDRIKEIPTLPTIVFELNRHLQDPDTSIAKVSETIEKDQAMALKLLKLVNSAFYGFKSRISNIRNAIVLLGFNTVRNAIVSVSVINAFSQKLKMPEFSMSEFWKHSLAVAVTSKSIAEKTKIESPDNCFVGGLLHDVGKVILAQYMPDLFARVLTTVQDDGLSFYEAERQEIPIDHTKIGAYLASKWQLPLGLVEAIRWHHDFREESENADFVLIIYLANIFVNSYNVDPDCVLDLSAMNPQAVKFMMRHMDDVSDWYSSLTGEIENAYAFFLE
jgi:putative nucleotidyltransferase with HDIG domain